MKKLKQMSGPYSIGFELSSTAHGFVATDPNGNVLYHGKQPVMGTRVFKEGQHAAEARMPRTSRRGIQRRRGREHEMERVFAPVISSIDPDFFIRRRMSYKLGKIRFESDPIGFSYAHVLGKEQVEVDNRIPFILGGSVRKIAKNHIYGFAGYALHHLKAIALNNPVAERL